MATLAFASADFPNGVNTASLRDEIRTVVPSCDFIAQVGDVYTIYFKENITESDEAAIAAKVASHVPPARRRANVATVADGETLIQHDIGGLAVTFIGTQSNEIHISKESQGQFSSIAAAIAANPGQDRVFILHPGDYVEPALTFAAGTVMVSCGNAENTFITAASQSQTIINMHVKCKLQGVCLRGGAVGVYFNQALSGGYGRYSAMMECFVQDCDVAIDCDAMNVHMMGGIADTLYGREIVISSTQRVLSKGVNVRRGGTLISAGVTMFGAPPQGPYPARPIMVGYNCEDAMSKLAMSITNCYFCGVAFQLNSGASSEMTLLTLKYNGAGVVIGSGAGPTRFSVNSLEIANSSTHDITVLNPNALVEVHSGVFDDTKISNPAGARLNMRYHTNRNGKTRQRMLGIINVGTVAEPAKMIVGEGAYDIMGAAYLTNTNLEVGTWANITADAIEDNGAPFGLFASADVGNCLYVGRDAVPMGVKIDIITPATGAIVWEKWDGAAWTAIQTMATNSSEPFVFTLAPLATVGTYHVRFGLRSNDPMPARMLNGVTKKWVRARVVSTLSAIPMSEYIQAHVSATKVGSDGFIEFFGDARTVKKMTWSLADMTGLLSEIWLTKKISANTIILGDGATASACVYVTPDIDCSFPVRVQLLVSNSVTESVDIIVRYDRHANALYDNETSAPATGTEQTTTVTVATTAGAMVDAIAMINIDHADSHPMWISIERVGTGSLRIIQAGAYYMSWTDGAHSRTY